MSPVYNYNYGEVKYLKSKGLNLMTNEVSINWNKNQSTERPIFEMFDDSEFESLQQEALALYGEACYVQESYEAYILEAAENEKQVNGILKSTINLVKNLIGRFIRAITRFMANHQCKKAVEFFGGKTMINYNVRRYIEESWPLPKTNPGYKLLYAAVRITIIQRHVEFYETMSNMNKSNIKSSKAKLEKLNVGINDTTDFSIMNENNLNERNSALRFLDHTFSQSGSHSINSPNNKTLKDIIKTLEKFNTSWTPYDAEGKSSPIVKMITNDIKAFAQFQSELLDAYKYFMSSKFIDLTNERITREIENNDKLIRQIKEDDIKINKIKAENEEKQKEINERIRGML